MYSWKRQNYLTYQHIFGGVKKKYLSLFLSLSLSLSLSIFLCLSVCLSLFLTLSHTRTLFLFVYIFFFLPLSHWFVKWHYTLLLCLTFVYLLTAGDGCFYIGMGAKSAKPTIPSYEPYQCCPSKVAQGTKVAKVSPISKPKLRHDDKPKRPKLASSTTTTTPAPPALKSINKLSAKDSRKTIQPQATGKKEDKPKKDTAKAKKGFFGSGNYHD